MTATPRKIMHVITGLGVGGAEGMLSSLVGASHPDGMRHQVVNLLAGGANSEIIRDAGVPLIELDVKRGRLNLGGLARLAKVFAREKPDVVQSWMYHADLAASVGLFMSGRRRQTRHFWGVRCSDTDFGEYGLKLRAVVAACATLSRVPHAIVANSESGRQAHRMLGYRPRRFIVVENGIDTGRFRPDPSARQAVRKELGIAPETPVVVLPARLDPMKDHQCFLDTMELLPEVTAIAVGANIQFLPERPNIISLGIRPDVAKYYAAADLVLSTSAFGEGFSNAIGEGMAAGLPAVATDVGDARQIIGETGLVVEPRRPDAVATAIRSLLGDRPEALAERGRLARQRICNHFSAERFVEAFDTLYAGTN